MHLVLYFVLALLQVQGSPYSVTPRPKAYFNICSMGSDPRIFPHNKIGQFISLTDDISRLNRFHIFGHCYFHGTYSNDF